MPNYQVKDAYGSVITIESSTIGSSHRQVVTAAISLGNTSVSGTAGASIVGQLPEGTAVIGSVAALQSTNPWITRGSVSGTVGASIVGAVNFNPGSVYVLNPVSVLSVNPTPSSVYVLNPVSVLSVNPTPSSVYVLNPVSMLAV